MPRVVHRSLRDNLLQEFDDKLLALRNRFTGLDRYADPRSYFDSGGVGGGTP